MTLSGATTPGQSRPEIMSMKGFSAFHKFQHNWNLTIGLFSVISRILVRGGGSYSSAEMESVYSTAPDDWT